jgi:hypothetical protein
MAKKTTKTTIFVGHKPGTFKAQYGLSPTGETGWYVAFLDMQGNISCPDGEEVYAQRQGAYRRAKQLNDLMAGQAEAQGAESGTVSGSEHEQVTQFDHHQINIVGSHEYRYVFAKQEARAKGYTTEQEIKAYADGFENAFLAVVLHDDSYAQAAKKHRQG